MPNQIIRVFLMGGPSNIRIVVIEGIAIPMGRIGFRERRRAMESHRNTAMDRYKRLFPVVMKGEEEVPLFVRKSFQDKSNKGIIPTDYASSHIAILTNLIIRKSRENTPFFIQMKMLL
jgi:hypothetical protein